MFVKFPNHAFWTWQMTKRFPRVVLGVWGTVHTALLAFTTLCSIRFVIPLHHFCTRDVIFFKKKSNPIFSICQFPNVINYHQQALQCQQLVDITMVLSDSEEREHGLGVGVNDIIMSRETGNLGYCSPGSHSIKPCFSFRTRVDTRPKTLVFRGKFVFEKQICTYQEIKTWTFMTGLYRSSTGKNSWAILQAHRSVELL